MNDNDGFYLQIAHALSGCQLVEQQLKIYITEALQLTQKCVGRRMTFIMSGQDYEDASLERLIGTFKKLTDNSELVTRLNKFKDERNFLSHQGITHCLDPEGELSDPEMTEVQVRLQAIQTDAKSLQVAIHEAANGFRGHLDFEDFAE